MKKITRLILLFVAIATWGNVANATNTECAGTSTDPSTPAQGTFTLGYNYSFTTVGTDVTVTFELLDAKVGLVAYAWTYNPGFAEVSMTPGTGQSFSKTFTGRTIGETFNVACKFAFSGGMTVTKTFAYTVGNACSSGPADTEAPTAFTATKGAVASSTVELLLTATDNSGAIVYTVTNGATVLTTSGTSATQKSYIVTGLNPSTAYNFSVVAKDAAGNAAANNPIVVSATTSVGLPTSPPTAAPTPTKAAAKVISIFSDAYTNVSGTQFNPNWGQSTVVTTEQIESNATLKYANLNYQGTQYTTTNAFAMTHLHVDVWTANETSLQVTPISPDQEKLYTLTPLTQGVWNSYDIPLTLFPNVDLANLFQFKFVGSNGKTVYLDNIYFFNNNVDVDATAPAAFSATAGTIASDAVELLLNATDDSGAISYTISYGAGPTVVTATGVSGVQKSVTVSGLSGSTAYSFSVTAKDATGNTAANSPIVVSATTLSGISSAPIPTVNEAKVMSVYSGSYTNLPTILQNWYGNTFSTVSLSGNEAMKDVSICCFGYEFTNKPINVSTMTKLHVDIYPITLASMSLGLTDGADRMKTGITLVANQWNSVDVLLSELTGANLANVNQVGFWNLNGTFYFDNLYFSNDTATGFNVIQSNDIASIYPNPIADILNVSSKTEISQVLVRNLLGQTVKNEILNTNKQTIDLSNVSAGNYFVTVKLANGQSTTQKIVKL